MKLMRFVLVLIATMPVEAQVERAPGPLISKACGCRVELPLQWKVRSSREAKCQFAVIIPNRADGDVERTIREGTLDDNQLGFIKVNGTWILQGEGSADAAQIESATWIDVQGAVGSRIYERGFYHGFGDQTRAWLFDRKHGIAEIACFPVKRLFRSS